MNETHIKDFSNTIKAEGLSNNRIRKYEATLKTISKNMNKDFKKVNKQDLIDFISDIENKKIKPVDKEEYAENTKRDFKVVIKRFWKWLKDTEDYPNEVKWIKTSKNHRLEKKIRTKDVLSEEEVYRMVDTATHTRDKAIISLLYESGSRISEIMNLKIKDIVFDNNGYNFISCLGKTGEIYKRVVNFKAVDILKEWLNQHPLKSEENSPLWITLSRSNLGIKKVGYRGIYNMLKEVAKTSDIRKKVNPHSFRHARITDLRVRKKVPDAIIEMLVGWKPGSDMFDIYQHAQSEDIDKALAEVYGVKEKQKENQAINNMENLLITDPVFRKKIVKLFFEKGVKI